MDDQPANVDDSRKGTIPLIPEPSRLFFQSVATRRLIIASYWLVILLALPLWWNITSIQRLSLPAARVDAQAKTRLVFPTTIQLDPSIIDARPSLLHELQDTLDDRNLSVTINSGPQETAPGIYRVSTSESGDTTLSGRTVLFPAHATEQYMVNTVTQLILPFPTTKDFRVVPYAPRYRLSFTLLNEDAAAGHFVTGWDIQTALRRHINPTLSRLSALHNFTIESQVQFHAPLAFEPIPLEDGSFGLTHEDLTVFINSAEWTLSSSSSNDPVLHFVLFIPSASQRPLKIMDRESTTFLIPQWGGVVIHNPTSSDDYLGISDLDDIFTLFSNHFLSLLGVPALPRSVLSDSDISDWQLDALLRRRALENNEGAKDILHSTIKLVDHIDTMPVGANVQEDVEAALLALEQLHGHSSVSLTDASRLSAEAVTISSRAFFNPEMLALLYFPAEHKYSVYTPLFASAVIPLMAATAREFVAWRKQRREIHIVDSL